MTRSRLAAFIGCVCLASVVSSGVLQAASITVDFTVTATNGPLAGNSYDGSFTYNNAGLTGMGSESVNASAFSFDFLTNNSLTSLTSSEAVTLNNGTLNSLAFLAGNGNAVASGTPDFYISLNQGIPDFLYGFDVAGSNFPNPDGTCPDALNACYGWEGSGTANFAVPVTTTPEPGGVLPVLGYVSIACGLIWMKRRRASASRI